MNNKQKLLTAAVAGVVALGASSFIASDANAADKEKCYGVAKAGANDCGANGHSCAGHSTHDADKTEFIVVPKGLCDRLAGGSTKAGS